MNTMTRLTERLSALIDGDAPAKMARPYKASDPDNPLRTRLLVPQMPHEGGLSCDWHCLPDFIESTCLIHSGYMRAATR